MSGEIAVDFGGLDQAANDLTAESQAIAGLLDEEREILTSLGGVWQGDAKEAWQAQQQRWQQKADDLNTALQRLCGIVNGVSDSMKKAESDNETQWG